MTAARSALLEGERLQREQGHGREGFLSREAGFLPMVPPATELPRSHVAWDQIAAELPSLLSAGRLGKAVEGLPLLSAASHALAPEGSCRASLILGVLAHAVVRERELARRPLSGRDSIDRVAPSEDGGVPEVILSPWREIGARMGRESHCLSFSDLVLYNWRLSEQTGPRAVANMRLLVPTVDVPEEHRFYLTFVETHAVTAPCVEGLVEAQEACLSGDDGALLTALVALGEKLRTIRVSTLHQIDPNPRSPGHVDPVVWSRLVAPLAAPVRKGEAGLSGGAAPLFHALDAFFGRRAFDTKVGREVRDLRRWLSDPVRAYVEGLSQVDVGAHVARRGRRDLEGAYRQAFEAYAGDDGWLFAHRIKVFGFMETGFKAGRTQTNGGFSGALQDRAWEKLDDEIDDARRERYREAPGVDVATPLAVARVSSLGEAEAHHIVLSIEGTGLRYQPGDRVAVLAQNDERAVARTLEALRASGDELIELDRRWRQRLAALGLAPSGAVSLRTFLTHAQLRPVDRVLLARLQALSGSRELKALLVGDRGDEVELHDAIAAMGARYQPRRLWQAQPWERESLARLVEPMRYRIYSIASAPDGDPPTSLDLSVRSVSFASPHAASGEPTPRRGVASSFLSTLGAYGGGIPIKISAPTRFRLPESPASPIVMFAGGAGIAPFRAFWQARSRQAGAGPAWLVVGSTDDDSVPFLDEMRREVEAGRLKVDVVLSRQDARFTTVATPEGPRLIKQEAPRGYCDQAISGAGAAALGQLIEAGATLYVCGATRFAATVERGVKRALGDDDVWARLIATGRCMLDIFTTLAPAAAPGLLGDEVVTASELATRNDVERGFWMAIRGQVYDVTAFLETHPGGDRILRASAGTDATASYQKVEHHLQPEVHAMLDLMKIGRLRPLDFGGRWGLSLGPRGFSSHDLGDLYEAWVSALFTIVELENGLRNNEAIALRGGATAGPSWLKARLRLEQLATFDQSLLEAVINETLPGLWALAVPLLAPRERIGLLEERLAHVKSTEARWPAEVRARIDRQLSGEEASERLAEAWAALDLLTRHAGELLARLKGALIDGARAFEVHQSALVERGAGQVLGALLSTPDVVAAYRVGPLRTGVEVVGGEGLT